MSNTQTQGQGRIKPPSLVFWLRFSLAVVAGFANHFLRIGEATLGEFALFAGIGEGLAFYMLSIFIVRYLLRYGEMELKGKNRYITLGGGTFVVVWIMVVVLLNTVAV